MLKQRPQAPSRIIALFLSAPALLVLTGCSQVSGLGFEENLSSVNDISLSLWQGAWIAAGVVGLITLILIVWPAIFHRKKVGAPEFPKQTQYNVPVEIAYTIIPFIIVAVLFYFTAVKESQIVEKSPTTVAHEIGVEGIQWSWQFSYPEAGPKAIVTGTPAQPPTLYVPLGERVRYTITSNDVVHGFWIPAFMIQIQNLPGVTNHLEFTANKLGTYPGRCNILCGRNHTQMIFSVKVVTPSEYKSYLETLKAANV
ncbi:MAG: cytochrome c oxidase subunit II [Actinobacteria bacterium]|uniref:cytochrome-c oxidase n=1 Tax=freshwater metagenome TaxID=449393 RepID=A0A6J6LL96_9ZZZZ|nr:cytochrome c oxidase subunit II [Actinomycetota bacterium]